MLINKIRLLTVVCTILQITNTYCMCSDHNNLNFHIGTNSNNQKNNLMQNINSISTEQMLDTFNDQHNSLDIKNNDINNQKFYIANNNNNNSSQNNIINNNQQSIITDSSKNENNEKKIFLGRKSKRYVAKRTGKSIPNVKLNYKEFMNANNRIKSCTAYTIEANNMNNEYENLTYAEFVLDLTRKCSKLENDKFPILDDLNLTHNIIYDDFKMNNVVQKVNHLKRIITDIIDYEDENCDEKSKDYEILKYILKKMKNDEMNKEMFKALENIGVIEHNPNRIKFFKDENQKTTAFNLDKIRKYFENVYNSNDNNELKKSIKTFYKTITNTSNKNIKMIFGKTSGPVKVIPKRFRQIITKIIEKMYNSKLNEEFIKFKLDSSNTTFNLMKQRLINGEEPIFDYSKTQVENEQVFRDYYKNMLNKTSLFLPTVQREKEYISEAIKALDEVIINLYNKNKKDNVFPIVKFYYPSDPKSSGFLGKINFANTIKNFLQHNGIEALDSWYAGLEGQSKEIMKKSWKSYIRSIDLEELLTTFENKIKNENVHEKSETIYNFMRYIIHYEKLSKKKTTNAAIEMLNNILTSNNFKNFITNEFVKNIFKKKYYNFYQIFNEYSLTSSIVMNSQFRAYYSRMIRAAHIDAMKMSDVFLSLSKIENTNYPDELKNILSSYGKSIAEQANNELKKYEYYSKFMNDAAIVPAGFWDNKLLYK